MIYNLSMSIRFPTPDGDYTFMGLVKNAERYGFSYQTHSIDRLNATLGQMAADPELHFTWYDAAVLSKKARKLCEEAKTQTMDSEEGMTAMEYDDRKTLPILSGVTNRPVLFYETHLNIQQVRDRLLYVLYEFNRIKE